MSAAIYELSDGEQLAVLEREGTHYRWASSLSAGCMDRDYRYADCFVFGVHADHYCDGVSGVGRGGAAGVFVEQRAAALDGCESLITDWLYGVSTYIERRGTGAKRQTIWKSIGTTSKPQVPSTGSGQALRLRLSR